MPSRHLGLVASCSETVLGLKISFNSNGQLEYYKYIVEDSLPFISGLFSVLSGESCRCRLIDGLSAIAS